MPQGPLEGEEVSSISAGDSHMAALTSSGKVYTWGTYKDSNGYIGYSPSLMKASEPTLVPGLPEMSVVACGADHTIGVSRDGETPAHHSSIPNPPSPPCLFHLSNSLASSLASLTPLPP